MIANINNFARVKRDTFLSGNAKKNMEIPFLEAHKRQT